MFSGERSALLIAAVWGDTKIFEAASPVHAPEDAESWMRFVALELAQVMCKTRGQHGNGLIGKGDVRHALGSVAVDV